MIPQRLFLPGGPKVGVLGLGTVKFGRNTGVKYPGGDGFVLPGDAEIKDILDLCIDHGVNVIDTAPAYGSSEERLGALLGARREKFFLSSKTGEEFDGKNSQYIFTADHTRMSVERSLKRLKTDYLDCVLVHCSRDDVSVLCDTDVLPTLHDLKREGKIRFIGASTYSITAGMMAAQYLDCVMVAYNKDYTAESAVIAAAAEKGCAVLIKKGLSSGHVSGDAAVADAIRFALAPGGVTSLIIGSKSRDNILKNIAAATGIGA
jgi:aryl-alcohol dehydrogenase-like predicted oxidoreductase